MSNYFEREYDNIVNWLDGKYNYLYGAGNCPFGDIEILTSAINNFDKKSLLEEVKNWRTLSFFELLENIGFKFTLEDIVYVISDKRYKYSNNDNAILYIKSEDLWYHLKYSDREYNESTFKYLSDKINKYCTGEYKELGLKLIDRRFIVHKRKNPDSGKFEGKPYAEYAEANHMTSEGGTFNTLCDIVNAPNYKLDTDFDLLYYRDTSGAYGDSFPSKDAFSNNSKLRTLINSHRTVDYNEGGWEIEPAKALKVGKLDTNKDLVMIFSFRFVAMASMTEITNKLK